MSISKEYLIDRMKKAQNEIDYCLHQTGTR